MPGPYWKLVALRKAHLGRSHEAYDIARSLAHRWKDTFVLHYFDMLATSAWLEYRENGRIEPETRRELDIFESLGARGKKALLTLQGFLPPNPHLDERQDIGAH